MHNDNHLRHSHTKWPFWSPDGPKTAILPQSGEGEVKKPRIFTRRNEDPVAETNEKGRFFTTEKTSGIHHSRTEWPLLSGEAIKTHVFCDAKRRSASPLSHGIAFWGSQWAANDHSTAEWRRLLFLRPFGARVTSLFPGARPSKPTNGGFRREW